MKWLRTAYLQKSPSPEMLNAATLFYHDYKTSPRLSINMRVSRSQLNLHSWVNLSFKLWKLPTSLAKHLLTHTNINSITHAAAVFKLYTRSGLDTGLRRQKHPVGRFQTRPQPATGQERHYNTEKSTRLSRTCTNTHPLIISAHNTCVFSKREQRDVESVCKISSLLQQFSVPGSV